MKQCREQRKIEAISAESSASWKHLACYSKENHRHHHHPREGEGRRVAKLQFHRPWLNNYSTSEPQVFFLSKNISIGLLEMRVESVASFYFFFFFLLLPPRKSSCCWHKRTCADNTVKCLSFCSKSFVRVISVAFVGHSQKMFTLKTVKTSGSSWEMSGKCLFKK